MLISVDITKDQIFENSVKGIEPQSSSTFTLDVSEKAPLVQQQSPQPHSRNNGISLHKAVALFASNKNPLVGDDFCGMDDAQNHQGQNESDRETVL